MRRLALLLAAPLLLSAAPNPVREAEREARQAIAEQQRLEQAAAGARDEAQRASAAAAAAAQAMLAADARIAASEAGLAALRGQQAQLERRLAEARQPATALMSGLVQMGRRPQWLALAGAGGTEQQVRLAALVRTIRPEVDRRTAALRGEYQALQALGQRQRQLVAGLADERQEALAARDRFAALERKALALSSSRGSDAVLAEDRVIDRSDRLASLRSEGEQRREATRLAAALADLPEAAPRPAAPDERVGSAPLAWTVPARGAVIAGLGELGANGVRSRGLTIATFRGAAVVAPADGIVAFAGPFRRREGVMILDHGGGWLTLLSEVRPTLKVGERVTAGQALGRALGPVSIELFRDGSPQPAALIARSSSLLLSSGSSG